MFLQVCDYIIGNIYIIEVNAGFVDQIKSISIEDAVRGFSIFLSGPLIQTLTDIKMLKLLYYIIYKWISLLIITLCLSLVI